MDLFVFPSEREGLGMALLEAQAAGLPCIISNSLTATVDVVPGLVRRLSLGQSPALWAEAALAAIREPAVSRAEALLIVRNGEFEIGRSVANSSVSMIEAWSESGSMGDLGVLLSTGRSGYVRLR